MMRALTVVAFLLLLAFSGLAVVIALMIVRAVTA